MRMVDMQTSGEHPAEDYLTMKNDNLRTGLDSSVTTFIPLHFCLSVLRRYMVIGFCWLQPNIPYLFVQIFSTDIFDMIRHNKKEM